MSETSTMPGAAVRLHVADEEEDDLALILGESPDGADENESSTIPDSIFDLEAIEEKPFDTLSEMREFEQLEMNGRMVTWPLVEDGRVHIAHLKAALEAHSKEERKLRSRKGWTYEKYPDKHLPGRSEELLWYKAMFGTAVKGWEGRSFDLPFNERNFVNEMLNNLRFRKFVYEHTGNLEDLRKKMKEDAEGN